MCLYSVKLTMKCARLHLQERLRPKVKLEPCGSASKPRRYCQKRMINPEHDEDPRWTDVLKRFHCNSVEPDNSKEDPNETIDSVTNCQDQEDIVLSVQTLQFNGDVELPKRSRTSFKYKTDTIRHRMFVKQVVQDKEYSDEDDRDSDLTSYYFDDYVKYLFVDKTRPISGKSSLFLQGLSNKKENEIQFDDTTAEDNKKSRKVEINGKKLESGVKQNNKDEIKNEVDVGDTKVTYSKTGRRKSLTISRTQSPETVQVIRVDVVCNYSCNSPTSDLENRSPNPRINQDLGLDILDLNKPHFSNKYLLTNTIKSLDEKLSGGSKVTLLCKTFTLSERSRKNTANKQKINTETKSNAKGSKKNTKRNIKFQKLTLS